MPDSPADAELLAGAAKALARHGATLSELGAIFADAGHELYLVGGSVRDALLGRLGTDLDFTTDARPERMQKLLRPWADALWDTGIEFGTIGVGKDGHRLEFTTFRADTYDQVSRNPEVRFGERLDDGAPHRFGQIVTHAVDDDETRTADRPCQGAAVARPHQRIVGAVNDDGRRGDGAGIAHQAAGAEDGVELTQHALRVITSGAQRLDAAAAALGERARRR